MNKNVYTIVVKRMAGKTRKDGTSTKQFVDMPIAKEIVITTRGRCVIVY